LRKKGKKNNYPFRYSLSGKRRVNAFQKKKENEGEERLLTRRRRGVQYSSLGDKHPKKDL